jgi:hypothetical protein
MLIISISGISWASQKAKEDFPLAVGPKRQSMQKS